MVVWMIVHVWIPEDQERMIEKYKIDCHYICIQALKAEIHRKAMMYAPWNKDTKGIIEVP
jgi:hypothetical protein